MRLSIGQTVSDGMADGVSHAIRPNPQKEGMVHNLTLILGSWIEVFSFYTVKMFAQKAVELIQELERAKDFLPPFNVFQYFNGLPKGNCHHGLYTFIFRKMEFVRYWRK